MTDLKAYALAALSALPARCAQAWEGEAQLPLIAVREYSGRVLAQADGAPWLDETVLAVDVYAADAAQRDELALLADAALTGAGFRRVFQGEMYDGVGRAHRKALRYRVVSRGSVLYQ